MNKEKRIDFLFALLFFIICLVPFVLVPMGSEGISENRVLSEFPDFVLEDGSFNSGFFKELDTFFSEHFFGRSMLIRADSFIKYRLFSSSPDSQVIMGKDGWMFFDKSIKDYMGVTLSDEELELIANKLGQTSEYIEGLGKTPLIMIIPNKNSIYPEYMPGYYGKPSDINNRTRLQDKMSDAGIPYIDAYQVLLNNKDKDELYFHTDTHWNNTGVRFFLNELYKQLDIPYSYGTEGYNIEPLNKSDLYEIAFPDTGYLEDQRVYEDPEEYFEYSSRVKSMDDFKIGTENPAGIDKKVFLFRDSFGRAMIPYMGEVFTKCEFNRSTPYDIKAVSKSDCDIVLIEIVERNIEYLKDIDTDF